MIEYLADKIIQSKRVSTFFKLLIEMNQKKSGIVPGIITMHKLFGIANIQVIKLILNIISKE